jgi:glutamate racemase
MIGLFDSGDGGLSVLREVHKLLPDEKYVFYGDNANCPYGEKTPEFIQGRARKITEFLIKKGAQIIVVACNTATAAAINTLRAEYSDSSDPAVMEKVIKLSDGRQDHIQFIGMEPAVKPAAIGTKTGVIGVLATAGTLKGSKYLTTKGKYEDDVKIVEHVGQGWVELVEGGILTGPKAEATVKASIQPLLDEGADTLVLGCTHYPFLMDTIRKVAGPSIQVIDPAPAVARHLIYVMAQEHLLNEQAATQALARLIAESEAAASGETHPLDDSYSVPDIKLYSSSDGESLNRIFKTIYPK